MNTEPPPILDPHSTYSIQGDDTHQKELRSPLSALLWGVMSFVCLGMDAFLLLMLSWDWTYVRDGHTSPSFVPLLLLTSVVLLLTWFSLRQCFRRD